jgi:hypothetical protein
MYAERVDCVIESWVVFGTHLACFMNRASTAVSFSVCGLNGKVDLRITLGHFLPHPFHMTPYSLIYYKYFFLVSWGGGETESTWYVPG